MSKKPFTPKSRSAATATKPAKPAKRTGRTKRAKAPVSKRRKEPDALLERVGTWIKEVRRERGMTQEELAWAIPLDRAHLRLIESGKNAPTIKTLVKIAAALDCEVGELIPPVEELLVYADWLEA